MNYVNTLTARFERVTISIQPGTGEFRWIFIPKSPEQFTYDADGNLLSDGRWTYEWDAENRLVAMQTGPSMPTLLPQRRLEFLYDYMHRRSIKRTYQPQQSGGGGTGAALMVQDAGSASITGEGDEGAEPEPQEPTPIVWELIGVTKFVWDGWLLLTELDNTDAIVRTHSWGLDASGAVGGVAGIGGLLFTTQHSSAVTYHAMHDARGDIVSLRDGTGSIAAAYEYGAFGESLKSSGAYAGENPHRSCTKYIEPDSGLAYFGHRYYNAGTGKWLSRDPLGERGGANLSCYLENDAMNSIDPLGLKRQVFAFGGLQENNDIPLIGQLIQASEGIVKNTWKGDLTNLGDLEFRFYSQNDVESAVDKAKEIVGKPVGYLRVGKSVAGCYDTLVVLGFSNGGHAAVQFAERLQAEHIRIELGFTVDPVRKFLGMGSPSLRVPSNTREWHNHYQTIASSPEFRGEVVQGAGTNLDWSRLSSDNDASAMYFINEAIRNQFLSIPQNPIVSYRTNPGQQQGLPFDPHGAPSRWTLWNLVAPSALDGSGNPSMTGAHLAIGRAVPVRWHLQDRVKQVPVHGGQPTYP